MSVSNYETIHRVGKGGCGSVYLVRHKENRKLYALKTVELDERKKSRSKENVQRESRILAKLKHPHIVLYHESFFDANMECLNIIQDYCDGGTLDDKVKDAARKSKYFDETQVMQWFIQIIMAVQYIHSNKVLHRDLKAENVFLTKKNVVKIGDFGISKVLENTIDVAQTIVGTPSYLSPELCQDIPYSSKSDIWAIGCLLYEMCALKSPFDAQNLISLFFKIIKAEFEPIPSTYTSDLQDLIAVILVKTPDDRPSASAILNTSLVKTHLAMFIQEKETLLQQKTSKDDSTASNSLQPLVSRSTASNSQQPLVSRSKTALKGGTPSPALKRNKLRISTPMIQKSPVVEAGPTGLEEGPRLSPQKQDSGLGISCQSETLQARLEVPKADRDDAASDYSDDFDESLPSDEDDDDIVEEIEGKLSGEDSDIEDISEQERNIDVTDTAVEYADDFEEYDSSEDLDQLVCQAREAQDIEAVDDWFADSSSEIHFRQTMILQQQCKEVLGGRELKEVGQLVSDGTLTENDLRHLRMRRSVGDDDAEICHLNIDDLESC